MFYWILAALLAVIYYLNQHYFSFWLDRGIPQANPKFLIGNVQDILLVKKSTGELFAHFYKNYKNNKVLGLYFLYRPSILVNDPQLVQDIMIKDFNNFTDRGDFANKKSDPLSAHLFRLSGQKWRDLRVKLTPTFTSGKLKSMYPIVLDCAKTLQDYVIKNSKSGSYEFDSRDLFARYTTNVISSVAFGIDNDCINDPDNIFRQMGLKILQRTPVKVLKRFVALLLPGLMKIFKIKLVPSEVDDFFFSIVKQTIDLRESDKSHERKDFMQLMIQLKNQGLVSADKGEEVNQKENLNKEIKKLSFNDVAAQAFVFFIAGFETSSSTMNYALFELSRNQEIQRKVQAEIDEVLDTNDINDLSYEKLSELKYLECCIDEALRKYPIVPTLNRECTNDYKFKGTDMKIDKGTAVAISVLGLQRDPEIYENPMEFRPERFLNSSNGGGKGKGLFYMPFGDGPRNCIGERMGKLQTKLGLATVLSKFNFELADKSWLNTEITFDKKQFALTPQEDFNLIAVPR